MSYWGKFMSSSVTKGALKPMKWGGHAGGAQIHCNVAMWAIAHIGRKRNVWMTWQTQKTQIMASASQYSALSWPCLYTDSYTVS